MVSDKSEYHLDTQGENPENAASVEGDVKQRLRGMFPAGIPNIYRMISKNTHVVAGLVALKEELARGELTDTERMLVALEVANDSECGYCQAALTHYCTKALGVSAELISKTMDGAFPDDRRLALVVRATRDLMEKHGKLARADVAQYEASGLTFSQLLEIIGVISEHTLATFASNLDRTRIDPEYRSG